MWSPGVLSHLLGYFLLFFFPFPSSSFLFTGVPSEGLLHGEPGSSAAHHGGLLEDDLGVEKLLHSHAYRAGRERAGGWMCARSREGHETRGSLCLFREFNLTMSHFLQEKCAQYWPSDGTVVYGDISIEIKKEEENESYTVRDLLVTNTRVRREEARKSVPISSSYSTRSSVLSAFRHIFRRTRPERCASSTSTAGQRWASPPTAKA